MNLIRANTEQKQLISSFRDNYFVILQLLNIVILYMNGN